MNKEEILEKQIELSSITQPLYLCSWNGSQIIQIHNRETFTKEYETTNMKFDSFDETSLSYESKHNSFNTMNEVFNYLENEKYGGLNETFICDNFEIVRIK